MAFQAQRSHRYYFYERNVFVCSECLSAMVFQRCTLFGEEGIDPNRLVLTHPEGINCSRTGKSFYAPHVELVECPPEIRAVKPVETTRIDAEPQQHLDRMPGSY